MAKSSSCLLLRIIKSSQKFEVDFTVGDSIAIEVKAKSFVTDTDLKGLRALKEEGIFKRFIVISSEKTVRTTEDNIEIVPLEQFLVNLWQQGLGL